MPAPDAVVEKRLANALFKQAKISDLAAKALGSGGAAGLGAVEKLMGCLWVGGTAYLTPTTVEFHPNAINKLAHKDPEDLSVAIPLASVAGVTRRFGLGTKIIDIETEAGVLSVRCYKSLTFAQAIGDAVKAARGD